MGTCLVIVIVHDEMVVIGLLVDAVGVGSVGSEEWLGCGLVTRDGCIEVGVAVEAAGDAGARVGEHTVLQ